MYRPFNQYLGFLHSRIMNQYCLGGFKKIESTTKIGSVALCCFELVGLVWTLTHILGPVASLCSGALTES